MKGFVRFSKAAWGARVAGVVGVLLLADPASVWAGTCGAHPCNVAADGGARLPNVCITDASRATSGGVTETDARPAGQAPCGVNYADCANDITLDFAISIDTTSAASGDTLQVWAGPSTTGSTIPCLAPSARKGSSQICWPLSAPITNLSVTEINVRAQDIAAHLDATSLPASYSPVKDLVQACQQSQTTPCPISLGIYIMLVQTDETVDGVPGVYDFQADVLGPHAPSGVMATINDGYATLTWTPSSDTCIAGYYVYCQNFGKDAEATKQSDASGDTGANVVDGGVAPGECGDSLFSNANVYSTSVGTSTGTDSGSTDTGTGVLTESGVVTPAVTAAGISDLPLSLLCASPGDDVDGAMTAGATSSSASINLTNYDYYVFAVAAVDTSGNVGPIASPLACGTPGPIDDFWYNYTGDGGLAGGGYCALQAVGSPGGSVVMGIGIAFAGAGFARRRRRRARGSR